MLSLRNGGILQKLVLLVIFVQISVYPSEAFLYKDQDDQHNFPFPFDYVPDREDFIHFKISATFDEYNKELKQYNNAGALLAWDISVNATAENLDSHSRLLIEKNLWNNHWCSKLMSMYHNPNFGHALHNWDIELQRELYLICRGPRFSSYQMNEVLTVLESLQQLYNKKVCIKSIDKCMRMEPELNRFMERSRNEKELREAWLAWHDHVGGKMKPLYSSLVRMLNQGARQAGFQDMGQCWREETEVDNLTELVATLYSDVKYLYSLLHSYVRHKLEEFYGEKFHNGLIPGHLLGNMWAQKWDSLMDILWSDVSGSASASNLLVNKFLSENDTRNVTVMDMVRGAEQFFVSMGLPKLPKSFWENSYFEEKEEGKGKPRSESKNCHGSAADMFGEQDEDYRMMMCAEVNDEDFITILHETGHIMYFMAYSKLPTIFQDGANSAFHESVGDSVTYDLLQLSSTVSEQEKMKMLFKTALAKLPQIGFGLVMDLWRWKVFESPNHPSEWNKLWWELNEKFLGIARPLRENLPASDGGLDAAGKFHIVDNIPYIRYFLASFLQVQFYEGMCKVSAPEYQGDLHTCQIRNSKSAGNLLWNMMKKGNSRHWTEVLAEMTGTKRIESTALLKYYKPLQTWLEMEISRLNLTIGW